MNENETVTEIETQIETYRHEVRDITTELELRDASDVLKHVKEYIKTIDEKRRSFVDPLNATVKKLNAQFKPYADMAEEVRRKIESKIIAFQSALMAQRQEEERIKREAEAEYMRKMSAATARQAAANDSAVMLKSAIVMDKKANAIENAPSNVSATIASDTSASTIRKTWTFDILDDDSVPRHFCSADSKKIREAISAGNRDIQGVRIYQKESIQTR